MALLDDMFKGWVPGVLVGVGVAMVAPKILPVLMNVGRPLIKSAIKGGLVVSNKMKELTAEMSEQFNDMVAEVKAESTKAGKEETPGIPPATQPQPAE